MFGAIYIHASPETYVQLAHDFDRRRERPGYLALGVFSDPPQLSDLRGFSFDRDEIQALKRCKPGECLIQMPASAMDDLHRSINWSAADVNEQVNQRVQQLALQGLFAYQREGNQALGVYHDKHVAIEVSRQFAHMLTYDKALPELPGLYHYLLAYPNAKPANVDDTFYWARVRFGLKPTLRIVQMVTMQGDPADQVVYAVAEKQLQSSHYFETALELSFCVRGSDDLQQSGFYLITIMGSEQTGLTGFMGSIIRKVAVTRSVSRLRQRLTTIRNTLEGNP